MKIFIFVRRHFRQVHQGNYALRKNSVAAEPNGDDSRSQESNDGTDETRSAESKDGTDDPRLTESKDGTDVPRSTE